MCWASIVIRLGPYSFVLIFVPRSHKRVLQSDKEFSRTRGEMLCFPPHLIPSHPLPHWATPSSWKVKMVAIRGCSLSCCSVWGKQWSKCRINNSPQQSERRVYLFGPPLIWVFAININICENSCQCSSLYSFFPYHTFTRLFYFLFSVAASCFGYVCFVKGNGRDHFVILSSGLIKIHWGICEYAYGQFFCQLTTWFL